MDNTFLPNYGSIKTYFRKNNLVYNEENIIPGRFTLNFCGIKEEKTFEQNLKTQPEDWYYRTHEVKYTLNSLGYRTREFDDIDWKESIVMFGCSMTFGIGVTDEHTIPYFLEQLSGRPVINMGIPGASIQTMLHNSIIFTDSKYPTPKAVVNVWAGLIRYQLYKDNFVFHNGQWNKSDDKFSKKENLIPFNLMNIKMIRNLWKNKTIHYECIFQRKAKTLIDKLDDKINCEFYPCFSPGSPSLARDLLHNGSVKNLEIATGIYQKLKLQLNN